MPNYIIKARNTSVATDVPVTADDRQQAVAQLVATAKPGEQMEVLDVKEVPADAVAPAKQQAHSQPQHQQPHK